MRHAVVLRNASMFALLLTSAACAADAVPDGTYACAKISGSMLMSLGSLTIDGDTYRGIDEEGDFHPYTVGTDGHIDWTGGLGSLTSNGWTHRYSEPGTSEDGKPLIKIYYTSKAGYGEVLDCTLE